MELLQEPFVFLAKAFEKPFKVVLLSDSLLQFFLQGAHFHSCPFQRLLLADSKSPLSRTVLRLSSL